MMFSILMVLAAIIVATDLVELSNVSHKEAVVEAGGTAESAQLISGLLSGDDNTTAEVSDAVNDDLVPSTTWSTVSEDETGNNDVTSNPDDAELGSDYSDTLSPEETAVPSTGRADLRFSTPAVGDVVHHSSSHLDAASSSFQASAIRRALFPIPHHQHPPASVHNPIPLPGSSLSIGFGSSFSASASAASSSASSSEAFHRRHLLYASCLLVAASLLTPAACLLIGLARIRAKRSLERRLRMEKPYKKLRSISSAVDMATNSSSIVTAASDLSIYHQSSWETGGGVSSVSVFENLGATSTPIEESYSDHVDDVSRHDANEDVTAI